MFCRKCGSLIEEGARFCGECGEQVIAVPVIDDFDPDKTQVLGQNPIGNWPEAVSNAGREEAEKVELRWDENPWNEQPQQEIPVNPTYQLILKIFAGIMTVIFGIYTVSNAFTGTFGTIGALFGLIGVIASGYSSPLYTGMMLYSVLSCLAALVTAVGGVIMVVTMVTAIAGWRQENAHKYPLVAIASGIVLIASMLLKGIIAVILGLFVGNNLAGTVFATMVPMLLLIIIAVGGMFGLTMLMGFNPMCEIRTASDFVPVMQIAVFDTVKGFTEVLQSKGRKKGNYAGGPQRQTMNGSSYVQTEPVRHLNTERGLAKYIILSMVTCGIYGLIMMHGIAKDLNTAFEGDGEETPGIWMYIFLTMLTCGIYAYLWMFWTGNRIAKSGKMMYGLRFEENGTTLLIWNLFSVTTCGIGGFMMWYYLLKNTNEICRAYNMKNNV